MEERRQPTDHGQGIFTNLKFLNLGTLNLELLTYFAV